MKTRNHRLICTVLLANLATTAITGSLIYGMLTGIPPERAIFPQAEAAAITEPAPVEGVRAKGAQPADFRASAGAAGEIVLLCRQARKEASGNRSGMELPREDRLKPLVDRLDRQASGQASDQFFF